MFTKQERIDRIHEQYGNLTIVGIFKSFGSDNRFHVVCSCNPDRKIVMEYSEIIKRTHCTRCRANKGVRYISAVEDSEPRKHIYYPSKSSTYTKDYVISCIECQYVTGAAERNKIYELTREEFEYLISGPCHYCGIEYDRVKQYDNGELKHLGIDRVHNHIGYLFLNCVSCCWNCNQAKRTMGYTTFLEFISSIYHHRCVQTH